MSVGPGVLVHGAAVIDSSGMVGGGLR
jgi:hypothetical protein